MRYELAAGALLAAAIVVPNYVQTTLKVPLPMAAKILLDVMVAVLVVSAVCSHLARWPLGYSAADPDALARLTDEEFWSAPASLGSRRAAELHATEAKSAHEKNQVKAWFLRGAIACEAIGIAAAGAAAVLTLVRLS